MKRNIKVLLTVLIALPVLCLSFAVAITSDETVTLLPTQTPIPGMDTLYPDWSFGDFQGNYSEYTRDLEVFLVSLGVPEESVRTQYGEYRITIAASDGTTIPFVTSTYAYDTLTSLPLYWSRELEFLTKKVCLLLSVSASEVILPQINILPKSSSTSVGVLTTDSALVGVYTSISGDQRQSLIRCTSLSGTGIKLQDYDLSMVLNSVDVVLYGVSVQFE